MTDTRKKSHLHDGSGGTINQQHAHENYSTADPGPNAKLVHGIRWRIDVIEQVHDTAQVVMLTTNTEARCLRVTHGHEENDFCYQFVEIQCSVDGNEFQQKPEHFGCATFAASADVVQAAVG